MQDTPNETSTDDASRAQGAPSGRGFIKRGGPTAIPSVLALGAFRSESQAVSSGTSSGGHCGPDITAWFVDALNTASNHPAVQTAADQWSEGTTESKLEALFTFVMLVQKDGPLDLKAHLKNISTEHCPSPECASTLTICETCYSVDVPGNIMYGVVGRVIGIPDVVLKAGAAIAQAIDNGSWPPEDDIHDTHAIDVGFAIYNDSNGQDITRQVLCGCLSNAENLNTKPKCSPCGEEWSPDE